MKLSICLQAFLLSSLSTTLLAAEALNLEDEMARVNYTIGYQLGENFRSMEVNQDALIQGFRDGQSGGKQQLSLEEMRTSLKAFMSKMAAENKKRMEEQRLEHLAAGEKFMQQNAGKEGVVTTASGLQYKAIETGAGKRPALSDRVTVHYRGADIDGTEFDSSHKRGKPTTFKLKGVIKGWSEGLQLMQVGGKSRLFIPAKLAYGDRGNLAGQTLIFDVELIAIEEPKKTPAKEKK